MVAVSVSVLVAWGGASAVNPLLPVYLNRHGSSVSLVGITMSAFFAAATLVQYPAGRLSDRAGHKKILIGGLIAHALGCLLFAALPTPGSALLCRVLQGAGAGTVDVANVAIIAQAVPSRSRGRAYSALYGSMTAGTAITPLLGGLLGVRDVRWLFVASAGCTLLGIVPILLLVPPGGREAVPAGVSTSKSPLRRDHSLAGVILVFWAAGLLIGLNAASWSLLLLAGGAGTWQIGLSWTIFGVSFAATSWPAGWIADHFDRRHLACLSLLAAGAFTAAYPFAPSTALLMGLGGAVAVSQAIALPAQTAQLMHSVPPSRLGRAQGTAATAQTAATAVAASLSGFLFRLGPALPFLAVAATILIIAGTTALLWRRVPGTEPGTPRPRSRPQ